MALVGVLDGDAVSVVTTGACGRFASRNAANNATVTVSGLTIRGAQAMDYNLIATTTANITPRPISISVAAVSDTKVYDGTTSASAPTITITSGSFAFGDVAAFTESFDTKNVGTGKTLTVTGFINDGNSGNNYALTLTLAPASVTTGVITPLAITVTASDDIKYYDGTTSASALPVVTGGSLAEGDTSAFTESFDTKNAGIDNKTLTVAGSVNDGNSGNNYAVTFVTITGGRLFRSRSR